MTVPLPRHPSWLLLAALAAPAPAAPPVSLEEGLPPVERHLPEHYRGFSQVTAVAVLPDDRVAFASTAAVFLYDRLGYTAVPVPATFANALVCDARGRLWTAGDGMVGVIETDAASGRPHYVSRLDRLPPADRAVGIVRGLAPAVDGTVYGVSERGVVRFGPDGTARFWSLPADNFARLAVVDGRVLHASAPSGLSVLDGDAFRTLVAPVTPARRIAALLPGGPGHARVLTATGSVLELALATGQLTPVATPIAATLAAHPPTTAFMLPDGSAAMTLSEGSLLLTDRDWTRARILGRGQGLGAGRVNVLAADRESGLWLGTNNGLTRLHLAPGFGVFDERSGLAPNALFALARHDGVLHAGGTDGLFRLVPGDPLHGTPARFTPHPHSPRGIGSLLSDRAGLLAGTFNDLVLLPADGPARRLLDVGDSVQALHAARRDPDLVFAGSERGLHVLRRRGDTFVPVASLVREIAVWSITEADDGALWCGTRSSGLLRITPPAGGDWTQAAITAFPLGTAGLPGGNGWTAAYQAFGELQFLADDGTHRWDAATATVPLDRRLALDGRTDLRMYPVIADGQGRTWTSPWHALEGCTRLLGWFDPARTWHDAPPAAGAAIGHFGAGRVLRETGEREILWIRGSATLVRLEPAALPPAAAPALWTTRLHRVHAAARAWPVDAKAAALPYSREPISFHFAAPRHEPGAAVRFRTRLLGFDPAWSDLSAAGTREFTNLSGGPFIFEVQAVDATGHAAAPARYAFAVTPPWHRSPLAYTAYLLAGIGGMLGFVRWRLGRAAREQRRLEALVAERTRDLAAARDQAETASQAKSAFLASMSHELRTPLNGVIGYAQVLQGDPRLLPDQRERVRIVHRSGEHLLRMINDVLDLAKIEAGKLELRPAPFAPAELAGDVAAAHAAGAAAKRLAFRVDCAADLPAWVEGDTQKLRQVLDNLLGNAVKFTARGGITLAVRRTDSPRPSPLASCPAGELLEFAVLDTGPGIAPDDQARLFHPFEQARATPPTAPGTGLGLAISRALVERMGGTLTVASTPGAGSRFSFALPLPVLAPPAAPASPRAAVTGYDGPRRRVLIVDDHDVNRRLLVDLLAPLGFACGEFAEPATALARLADGAEPWPDLAIVDLRMAGLDGLELTRRLRALPRGAGLRVLLTSASVISFNPAEARAAGCDDFLPKPFRTADLVEKIGALLALRWHEAAPAATAAGAAIAPPADARAALREVLAQGDLEAFRAALARVRTAHPAAAARWAELDEAAAGFQLSRLRTLLDQP